LIPSPVPSLEPSLILSTNTVRHFLSSTVPSLKSSFGILPPSSLPSLEPSFDSSSIPSSIPSMEPSLEPSTSSVTATYEDDGPTKAIISSYCHNLRLPMGTEIFILLLEAHNSKPSTDPISVLNELTLLFVTALTVASSTVPSLEPSWKTTTV
jgi:hypothetical protein